MSILKRHSFWNLVVQSIQIMLGTAQGITFATEDKIQTVNYIFAACQAFLGIISLWTADRNKNDIVDIAEELPIVTVTTPDNVKVEVKQENAAHSFTEGFETIN